MRPLLKTACAALLVAGTVCGQSQTLTTTFASNNGQSGNQFDIVAINDVTICSFDVNIDALNPTETMEVWIVTGGGTKVGNENNPAAWTLVSSTTVTSLGTNVPTPLNLALNVQIPAGTTQGFYVTCTTSTNINYTNGTVAQAVYASDANMQFLEGTGHGYPFTANFNPRVWNGNINYELGLTVCPPPPLGPWQFNSADCSCDINGLTATGSGPILFEGCPGAAFNANVSGMPNPWEIVIQVNGGAVPDLGLLANNAVNVNPFAPNSVFLLNLAFATALPTTTFPLNLTNNRIDWQVVTLSSTSPDGFALSAACAAAGDPSQFSVSVPGPTADDIPITVDVTLAPLNVAGGVNYYGTNYSIISVMPNGRVGFGPGDTDFTPTVGEYLGDEPSLGVWADFNPAAGGSVTVGLDCAGLRLITRWEGVPYLGQTTGNDFDIAYDVTNSDWSIENLPGVTQRPTAGDMIVGFCPGLGATDPGAQDFTQGAGIAPNATDALYEFGSATTVNTPGGILGGTGPFFPLNGIVLPGGTGPFWMSM